MKEHDSVEKHDSRKKGVWIPIDIWLKLEAEELTFIEWRLYEAIDDLVQTQGIGCFASNETLAKKIKRKVRNVQYMIQEGIKNGYLIQKGWKKIGNKKFRLLETAWSRIEMIPKPIRDATDCMSRDATDCIQRIVLENERREENSSPAARTSPSLSSKQSPKKPKGINIAKIPPAAEFTKKLADEIIGILRSRTPVIVVHNTSRQKNIEHLIELWTSLKEDEPRILRVVRYLKENISTGRLLELKISSVHSFCKLFNWIEDIMDGKGQTKTKTSVDGKRFNMDIEVW